MTSLTRPACHFPQHKLRSDAAANLSRNTSEVYAAEHTSSSHRNNSIGDSYSGGQQTIDNNTPRQSHEINGVALNSHQNTADCTSLAVGHTLSVEALNISPRQQTLDNNKLVRRPSYSDATAHLSGVGIGGSCNFGSDIQNIFEGLSKGGGDYNTSPNTVHLAGRRAIICKDGSKPALSITNTAPTPLNLAPHNNQRARQQLLMKAAGQASGGGHSGPKSSAPKWVSVLDTNNVFNSSVRRLSVGASPSVGPGTSGELITTSDSNSMGPQPTITANAPIVPLLMPFKGSDIQTVSRRRHSDESPRIARLSDLVSTQRWISEAGAGDVGSDTGRFKSDRERPASIDVCNGHDVLEDKKDTNNNTYTPIKASAKTDISITDGLVSQISHSAEELHALTEGNLHSLHAGPAEQAPAVALSAGLSSSANSPSNSVGTHSRRLAPIFSLRQHSIVSREGDASGTRQAVPSPKSMKTSSQSTSSPHHSSPHHSPTTRASRKGSREGDESPTSPTFVHGIASLKALRTGFSPSHPDHTSRGGETVEHHTATTGSTHHTSTNNTSIYSTTNSPSQPRKAKGSHFALVDDVSSQNTSNTVNSHLFGQHSNVMEHHRTYSKRHVGSGCKGWCEGIASASASDPMLMKDDSASTYDPSNCSGVVRIMLPQHEPTQLKHFGSPTLLGTGASVHSIGTLTTMDDYSQRGGVTPEASPLLAQTPSNCHRLRAPGDPLSLGCSLVVTPNGTLQGTFAGGNVVDVRAMNSSASNIASGSAHRGQNTRFNPFAALSHVPPPQRMTTGATDSHLEVVSQGSSGREVVSTPGNYLPPQLPTSQPVHPSANTSIVALATVPSYVVASGAQSAGGVVGARPQLVTMGGSGVSTVIVGPNLPVALSHPSAGFAGNSQDSHLVVNHVEGSNMSASQRNGASNSRALPCAPPIGSGDPSYAPLTEAMWRRDGDGDDDGGSSESSQCLVVEDEDDIIFQ